MQAVLSHHDTSFHCPGHVLDASPTRTPQKLVAIPPVVEWLRKLGLAKYEELFIQQEIDWDTLQWLTEEVSFICVINKKRLLPIISLLSVMHSVLSIMHSQGILGRRI